jgi:hypothetical protein
MQTLTGELVAKSRLASHPPNYRCSTPTTSLTVPFDQFPFSGMFMMTYLGNGKICKGVDALQELHSFRSTERWGRRQCRG